MGKLDHPYRQDVEPSSFSINYCGMVEQYHAFRIGSEAKTAMQMLMMRGKIANWLLEECRGTNHVGNGFGASKHHPKTFSLDNPDGKDLFVLLDNLVDVAMFESAFEVPPPPQTWAEGFAAARVMR